MRSTTALLLFLLTMAFSAAANEPILCSGFWSPALSEQALIRAFGRANVVREMVYIAEGEEEPGTVLYPNNEDWRLEIVWQDGRRYRSPAWIRVPAGSNWRTYAGIYNGMPLANVEKLNGRPFKLSGFDWDYGGLVTDWRSGRLASLDGTCSLGLQFDREVPERPTRNQENAIDATSGDRELLSSAAPLRLFRVRVNEMIIQYPE